MLTFTILIVTILILPRQFMVLSQSLSSSALKLDFSSQPSSSNAAQIQTILPLSESDKKFTLFTWSSAAGMNNSEGVMAREAFTFNLHEPAILQLIDFKHPGDRFQVFDNDQSLGMTAFPKALAVSKDENNDQGSLYAGTPALAMEDKKDRYSKGQILLIEGKHTITIKVWTASPSIDIHGTDVSGGGIRLMDEPIKPQKLFRGNTDDYEENQEDDDYEENDDEEHDEDGYWDDKMETVTVTVVVPPLTKDRWEHTELNVMTVTDVLGVSAATYTPPAGRTGLIRNPRCGMN